MRKIMFRGKSLDDGLWLYGYVQEFYQDYGPHHICVCCASVTSYEETCLYAVDPATVGQFIGRKDSNGEDIFEGDIIEVNGWCYKIVEYKEDKSAFCVANIGEVDDHTMDPWSVPDNNWWKEMDVKVVGNIHQFSELLEKSIHLSKYRTTINEHKKTITESAMKAYPSVYKNLPLEATMYYKDAMELSGNKTNVQ